MKHRDLVRALEKAGYHLERDRGDHAVYEKPGCRPITLPRHREVNENTAREILKQAGLK